MHVYAVTPGRNDLSALPLKQNFCAVFFFFSDAGCADIRCVEFLTFLVIIPWRPFFFCKFDVCFNCVQFLHFWKNGRWCFRKTAKFFEQERWGNLETLENILLFNILFLSTSSHAFYLVDGSRLNACWKPLSFLLDNFCSEFREPISRMLSFKPEKRPTLEDIEKWTRDWLCRVWRRIGVHMSAQSSG